MNSKKIEFLIISLLVLVVFCIPSNREVVSYVWNNVQRPMVVIDAGHGGVDGGAESADGVIEKDVNLKIAMLLKERLEDEGIGVVMTREDENGLYGQSQEGSIRTLKTRDMHERKRIIDETSADLTVSIHLNSFTQDLSVKGAQVFYPSAGDAAISEKSREAAEVIQAELNKEINEERARTEMGKDDVFLLKNVTAPIIIAECGFLSNADEKEKLKAESWQKRIAETLEKGICKFLENQK